MTTLRQGDRGPAVLEVQWLLRATGHDPGQLDGVFGPRTLSAALSWLRAPRADVTAGKGAARAFTWLDTATSSGIVPDDAIAHLRSLPRRAVEMPRMLTPIAAVDMRIALVAGYATTFGDIAESMTSVALAVRIALAQFCVEHGCEPWDGRLWAKLDGESLLPRPWLTPFLAGAPVYVYVWNFNVGNRQVRVSEMTNRLPSPSAPTVPWSALAAPEGIGAASHVVTSACYSYPNAAEGAAAYWRFLRDHCGHALAAFEAGDPAAAAHELKVGAWHYSGDEAAYAKAMIDRFKTTA